MEPYDADLDNEIAPAGAARFRSALEGADALLIATPEYNSSVPGTLKNALDWASRPLGASALTGLPVAVIGASTGRFGAVWAQAELRKILAASGARVVDGELAIGRAEEAIGPHGLSRPGGRGAAPAHPRRAGRRSGSQGRDRRLGSYKRPITARPVVAQRAARRSQ